MIWPNAAGKQRHPGAISGFKTKKFGGTGYTHRALDDTDQQQRVRLKTTQQPASSTSAT